MTDHTDLDALDGVTELDDLTVKTVSGVSAPANGISFTVIKSSADPAPRDWRSVPFEQWTDVQVDALAADTTVSKATKAEIADKLEAIFKDADTPDADEQENPVNKRDKRAVKAAVLDSLNGRARKATTSVDNTGGPGLGKPNTDTGATQSPEADDIQQKLESGAVKGSGPTFEAAKSVLLDPKASPEAKRVALSQLGEYLSKEGNGGDAEPNPSAVASLGTGGKLDRNPSLAKMVDWLDANKHRIVDPVRKMAVSDIVSHYRLATHVSKSAYDDANERTAEIVRHYQELSQASTGQVAPGTSGGALIPHSLDPRQQTGALGSPTRLASTGRIEPEPGPRVTGQAADEGTAGELAKAEADLAEVKKESKPGSTSDRERDLAEQVTRLRLRMTHEG